MPAMKPQEFSIRVKKEGVPSVVFLFGEEKYLIDEEAEKLKEAALSGSIEEFNYDNFQSVKLDWGAFGDVVDTLPMMASKRVVRLEITKDLAKKDSDALLDICSKCPESSLLLITASEDLDFRKAYAAKLQKDYCAVRYYSPFPSEIPKWVIKFCKKESISVEMDAAQMIHELIGGRLQDLQAAVVRLKLFLGSESDHVDTEVVEKVLAKTREDSVFDFANFVANNQRLKALEALKSLKAQGQNEVGAFSILNRHIQNLFVTKELLSKGEDRFVIAKALGVAPFFAKDYISQAGRWSEAKLQASIHALSLTDKALKSSPLPQSVWLENFVIKICR